MRILLCGIYGGLGMRDLNPGCFMLAKATIDALQSRMPDARFEVLAPDVYWKDSGGAPDVEVIDGVTINFGAMRSDATLRRELASADGIVFGGDNLWTVPENPIRQLVKRLRHLILEPRDSRTIWLLERPVFPASKVPIVFNCVSSRNSLQGLRRNKRRLVRACSRAAYVGVRDVLLDRCLRGECGLSNVFKVPDPVLGLNTDWVKNVEGPAPPIRRNKPILGVAVGPSFSAAFAESFRRLKKYFSRYHVCFYAYSRMHQNWESHANLARWLEGDVSFIHDPLSPAQAFRLTGMFDVVMNDCYHGTIAAIIQGVPVIPFKFFEGDRSRRAQLFQMLSVPDRSIKIAHRWEPVSHSENVEVMVKSLPDLLENPVTVPAVGLQHAKTRLEQHFDEMANALRGSSRSSHTKG